MTKERILDKKNGIDLTASYTYDAAGKILKQVITGADGERLETGWRYDLKDRLTHAKNQSGAVTRYIYDQNDQLIKEIHPYSYEKDADNGNGTSYAYDKNGNLTRVTNALDELVQELSYNRSGLPITQTDASGNRTAFIYESDGQLKEVRRGNPRRQQTPRAVQQYEYNARGQITGIIDGNHEKTTYSTDGWGRITGTGFSDGVKEGYEYNYAGQVSRTINGNGNAIEYSYNSLGKVRERTDQLGYKETFQYDEEGNLALHTDRDGRQVQRIYNVFGDPVYEKATNAGGENPCISTWRYDSLGRLVHAVCDGHSYEYAYDSHGNLKEKRSNGKLLVAYTYDSTGNITEIKDPAGISTRYEYDLLGRMTCIHSGQGMKVQYGYDSLDRIEHIHYGNGVQTNYAYDCDGNISHLETRTESAVLLSFDYKYDGNGNRTAKTGIQGLTAGSSALDIRYQYDVRGQLLEECRNGAAVCYAYDAAGNRIRKTEGEKETKYRYNQKNQLLQKEDADGISYFTYDRQGGIIEEKNVAGNRRFTYNSLHQQTQVETETGNIQKNRYDAEGLRYELIENGRRTSFVYHNGELLHEKGEKAGLSKEATSYHLGAGIEAFQRDSKTYYYHQDEQLNTTLITDEERKLRNHYQYDAFGAGLEASEALPNRIRYTGQQYDEQTGQYYLRARYYNPVLGRFMQEDVYQGDGLNLYAYCHNNPVMYFDLSGYDEGLFVDKVVYGEKHDSIELRFQLLKHMTGDEDLKKGTIRIKSHETQHVFPTQQDTNPALSIAGFQTNHYQNAVFDRNRGVNGKDASSLADFLSKYSIRRDVKKQYIANNTHHGVYTDKKTTVFAHKAYTDYVYYKVDKETSEFNINERMQKYSGGKIEQLEGVRLEMNKNMVKDEKSGKMITEITALRNKLLDVKDYFKKRNLAGIDLYLEHPKNKKIKNYYTHDNNGKIRTEKEAMEYFAQKDFHLCGLD